MALPKCAKKTALFFPEYYEHEAFRVVFYESRNQSLMSTYDYKLPQIQMEYINCTQAYFKPKKTFKASRYNKTRLISYKPTDRNKTLKKITTFMWRKPQKN